MAQWGYTKLNGPRTERWAEVAPAAKGERQSPIDIKPSCVKFDEALKSPPLEFSYKPENTKSVTNNGKSVVVDIGGNGSSVTGGPVKNKYEGVQFHWHWGKENEKGSEHTVDGKMCEAELHIVNYNTELFPDFPAAAQQDKGLCVLGAFLKVGQKEHKGYKDLLQYFSKIQNAGQSVKVDGGFDPACLLPGNTTEYWTYEGSLTTPPCFESVTWIVFKEPVEVTAEQIEAFRALKSTKEGEAVQDDDDLQGQLVENYRPPCCCQNKRDVRASFQ